MARMTMPAREEMTAEQRAVHDEAASGVRGHAPAPMAAWIRNPELAHRAQKLGELLRYQTTLPPRLSELAILVVARDWTAHYEWKAHKPPALKGGLSPAIIDAIASRQAPVFTAEDERVVYTISTTLVQTRGVPDDLYAEGLRVLGEQALVELVGVLGYYTFVAMTLNTFTIGLPDAFQPELGEAA